MNRITRMLMGVLIITTTFANAQSEEVSRMFRSKGGIKMTTISPISQMKFLCPTFGDTIFLNVLVDSIGYKNYQIALYVYYPQTFDPSNSNIIIGYMNGMADLANPVYINKDREGKIYVEYYIKGSMKLIRNIGFEYLRFEHIAQIKNIDTPNYFKNFLRRY